MNEQKLHSFWQWFQVNASSLYLTREGHDLAFRALSEKLKELHPRLSVELSQEVDGERELILSADAEDSIFPIITKICNYAPEIAGFKIIPLRKKLSSSLGIWMDGHYLETNQISFVGVQSQKKWNLCFFVTEFKGSQEACQNAVSILLEHTLGERNVAHKIKSWKINFQLSESRVAKKYSELNLLF